MSEHVSFSLHKKSTMPLKASGPVRSAGRARHGVKAAAKDCNSAESAFLAERGCLGAVNLPRPGAPAMQH